MYSTLSLFTQNIYRESLLINFHNYISMKNNPLGVEVRKGQILTDDIHLVTKIAFVTSPIQMLK